MAPWGINTAVLHDPFQSEFLQLSHLRVKNQQQLLNMKLVIVLMLAALPLYCYAGELRAGRATLETAIGT